MTLVIGFGGLSHLGIVSSIAAASKGYQVIGYDPDSRICDSLREGQLPIFEPDLPELLEGSRSQITFTDDPGEFSKCQLIFLSADVATDEENSSDLAPLRALIDQVSAHLSSGTVLVVMSQVPPGFTRGLERQLNNDSQIGPMPVFYQAETLVLGNAVERTLHPERFIVGCDNPKASLPELYAEFLGRFDCPILPMRYESGEMAKLSINMFLASSVSTTNTLAELCEAFGADWSEVVPVLQSDRRIGPHAYLQPGLGLSGGNLERDLTTVVSMAGEFGTDGGVVKAWLANSRHRGDWVLDTVRSQVLAHSNSPAIAIWGLAYKPGTSSTKNSPALSVIDALSQFTLRVYDPQATLETNGRSHVAQVKTCQDACRQADALLVLTPWPEFSDLKLTELKGLMHGGVIIDPFGALDGQACVDLGFSYHRLGVSAKTPELVK